MGGRKNIAKYNENDAFELTRSEGRSSRSGLCSLHAFESSRSLHPSSHEGLAPHLNSLRGIKQSIVNKVRNTESERNVLGLTGPAF